MNYIFDGEIHQMEDTELNYIAEFTNIEFPDDPRFMEKHREFLFKYAEYLMKYEPEICRLYLTEFLMNSKDESFSTILRPNNDMMIARDGTIAFKFIRSRNEK